MAANPEVRMSTRLGNALGGAMRLSALTFDYFIPLVAIRTYQLIPADGRRVLFGGSSASVNVVRKLRTRRGGGWELIRIAASNHPDRPT
jgi:hypothetical protein